MCPTAARQEDRGILQSSQSFCPGMLTSEHTSEKVNYSIYFLFMPLGFSEVISLCKTQTFLLVGKSCLCSALMFIFIDHLEIFVVSSPDFKAKALRVIGW